MIFELSKFKEDVSELAEKPWATKASVEQAMNSGHLNPLDVAEVAFLLQDDGKVEAVKDAEEVYGLPVQTLHQHLSLLSETA